MGFYIFLAVQGIVIWKVCKYWNPGTPRPINVHELKRKATTKSETEHQKKIRKSFRRARYALTKIKGRCQAAVKKKKKEAWVYCLYEYKHTYTTRNFSRYDRATAKDALLYGAAEVYQYCEDNGLKVHLKMIEAHPGYDSCEYDKCTCWFYEGTSYPHLMMVVSWD